MAAGGKRPGAGRPKGSPNKNPAPLKQLAREYTEEALNTLLGVMRASDSDAAKVAAANSVLDRGYGKATTVLSGDEDGGAMKLAHIIELVGVKAAS